MIREEIKHIDATPGALKKFGYLFTVVSLLIGVYIYVSQGVISYWALSFAVFFCFTSLVVPKVLKPLNYFWMILAIILGVVMSRVILTAVFYLILTPIGLWLRMTGKDLLRINTGEQKLSYWQKRTASENSMQKQF